MLRTIILSSVISLTFMQKSFAKTPDMLHLSGNYICHGYDMHDKGYQNATATLILDENDSDFSNNYGAYHFKLVESDGTKYIGEAAASGNNLAIYFENTDPKMLTDRGVGIAVVTHDKDMHGKTTTVFHKFYYEPTYEKGGNGYETCIKQGL